MSARTRTKLRHLEGRQISLALVDGSRIDDAALVSSGRGATTTIWIHMNRQDEFIPMSHIIEVWECDNTASGSRVRLVA